MNKRQIALFLATALAPQVFAGNLDCFEEEGTMNTICIQPTAARANGDIRSSPLFMGGPKSVKASSFVMITNCAKGVTTLQDHDGKNFAGGKNSETKALRSLSTWLCAVKKPKNDPTLRQF